MMRKKITKAVRQEVVREFISRHNGRFDPEVFESEVHETGPEHPAYGWFTWDDATAARHQRIQQAREFIQGLKIRFEIEEVSGGPFRVRTVEMPFAVSPSEGRANGGGYHIVDPSDPEHVNEVVQQAVASLRSWMRRYGGAIRASGESLGHIEEQIDLLEMKSRLAQAAE